MSVLRTFSVVIASILVITLLSPSPLRGQPQEEPLSLEKAVAMALENNEGARIALEQKQLTEARLTKARAYFLPTISTVGTYTRRPNAVTRSLSNQSVTIQSLNALSATTQLNLTLFDSKSIPSYRQASFEDKAQKFTTAESRRRIAYEAANAFLQTLSVDNIVQAAQHRLDLAKKNREAASARFSAGLISSNDLTRWELEVATAERELVQASGEAESTHLQLSYLLNTPVPKSLKSPDSLVTAAETEIPSPDPLIATATTSRLDLESLQWKSKAAQASTLEPLLKWFPSVVFNAQTRTTNEAGLTGKNTTWSVGLTASWSIFDGFSRTAELRERRTLTRIARLDLEGARRKAENEVRDAFLSLKTQQSALKRSKVAFDFAKQNADETAELYSQGLTGTLQVTDANVQLFDSEVEHIRSRYGLAIALLNLRLSQGLDPFGKEPL